MWIAVGPHKEQGGDWADIFKKGGVEGLLETIKGIPIYDNILQAMNNE